MTVEELKRSCWAFLFAIALSFAVLSRNEQEIDPELKENKQRYVPYLPNTLLPWYVVVLMVMLLLEHNIAMSLRMILSLCFDIFLHISIYYLLLLLLIPLLRRYVNARICATLWLLPNYLYLVQNGVMELSKPRWILHAPGKWVYGFVVIWFTGFIAVLAWKVISHFRFRHKILDHARTVTDTAILDIWNAELVHAGLKKWNIPLVISPEIHTPLSIGFFRHTIRVVLPKQPYTAEELSLVLRHEIIHIGRGDSATKFFLVFCTAMCWFNPLMWIAMRYSADDLELSCDETTLLEADAQKRHQYADILLRTAGDERGFTTCLSASAAALRYRLRNIMNAKERFSGTILVGLFFFCLMISCGHIALAYNESTGHEYIFSNEDCSTYSISSIRRQSDAGYSSFDLTDETLMNNIDETAICHYLSGLSLSHMTGNYSKKLAASLLSVSFRGPHGPVYVYLQENAVVVHSIQKEKPATEMYHCNEEIDWDYLDSLLTASPATS